MDKKESILEKELKKLEKIGVREISKATHIQEELISAILEKNFEKLLDCNTAGFIKILERDYSVDLSEFSEEFNKIKSETKTTKTTIDRQIAKSNLQNHKKTNWKIWILFALILAGFIVYFQFYDLIKKPIDEFLHDKKVDYSNTPTINKAEETLVSVGVEVPKFDENDTLIVPEKMFANLENNDTNNTATNALDLSIQMQNSKFDTNLTDKNLTQSIDENSTLPAQITIIPSSKIWIGTIDLSTSKKWDAITSDNITLDLDKDWLVITGHGHFTIDKGVEKQELKEKEKVRIYIKDKNISFIDNKEFMRLNGGKGW